MENESGGDLVSTPMLISPFNKLLGTDGQPKFAASRRTLPAGQRRR